MFCDYFTSFLAFPESKLSSWKGFPSNNSEKLGLLCVGQDLAISALKHHKLHPWLVLSIFCGMMVSVFACIPSFSSLRAQVP